MAEDESPKKRGRPAKFAGERTRGALTVRLRDEVRSDLEQAATRNGRSLSEEIETRMEISLAQKNQLKHEWGEDFFQIAAAMAASLSRIEDHTGSLWTDNDETFDLFLLTSEQIIKNYRDRIRNNRRNIPSGDLASMSKAELADLFAALGGLPPPRPKRPKAELLISDED